VPLLGLPGAFRSGFGEGGADVEGDGEPEEDEEAKAGVDAGIEGEEAAVDGKGVDKCATSCLIHVTAYLVCNALDCDRLARIKCSRNCPAA
jgi:hypothetical protein